MTTVRKLSPIEWLRLVAALFSFMPAIVSAAGASVRDFLRRLLDITAQAETLIPNETAPDGTIIKKGKERLALWLDLVAPAFGVEGESHPFVDRLPELASTLVGVINVIGAFKRG